LKGATIKEGEFMAGPWVEEGDANLAVSVEVVAAVCDCGGDGGVAPLSFKG